MRPSEDSWQGVLYESSLFEFFPQTMEPESNFEILSQN